MKKNILIIGAGMAGLLAGHRLTQAGYPVTILDKGRGVGGRMATRRVDEGVFDHGAQYFTARDPRFITFVQEWQRLGLLKIWSQGFYSHPNGLRNNGENRYYAAQGMTQIAKHLAQPLLVHTAQKVTQINQAEGGWQVVTETGQSHTAEVLLLTAPAEQSLALLRSGNYPLPAETQTALEAIQYDPCFAIMALLDRPTQIPAPGGMWVNSANIHWLADNAQKGISSQPSITIHATADYTRTHWDLSFDTVARQLLEEAKEWLGEANVLATSVQRWRYSEPIKLHPTPCLGIASPLPLAFGGDGFGGSRVEGAALSGLALADWVINL